MTNVKSCGYSLMIVWENDFYFTQHSFGRKPWPILQIKLSLYAKRERYESNFENHKFNHHYGS